jgi:DNA-binding transcriptional ArsR family regulator
MKDDGGADVWRALADPSRRALLDLLRDGPKTTGELAGAFPGVTRFAVMKHLGVLVDARLVVVRRRGRERWNHLNAVPLRRAYERWMAPFAESGAVTALRLKDYVEAGMNGTLDVANEVVVAAPREKVFDAIVRMGAWWPHRFRDGSTVVFEPRVGGRFYEDWGGDGGALYGTVVKLSRPDHVAVQGLMGMSGPVQAIWSMDLVADGDATVVKYAHRGFGDISDETRESYTQGWGEVFAALRRELGLEES